MATRAEPKPLSPWTKPATRAIRPTRASSSPEKPSKVGYRLSTALLKPASDLFITSSSTQKAMRM